MARADESVEPSGDLVSVDLSAADGEGTVCTEAEASWYIAHNLTTKPAAGAVLSEDDVYGADITD